LPAGFLQIGNSVQVPPAFKAARGIRHRPALPVLSVRAATKIMGPLRVGLEGAWSGSIAHGPSGGNLLYEILKVDRFPS